MIYRIANNLICQGSNVVVISHLKQFIGCSFTIIHEGHACFMNNQSNSNTSRLDNEELLRGMRPIQAQRWSRTNTVLYVLPWALHRSHCESVFLSLWRVCMHLQQWQWERRRAFTWVHFLKTCSTSIYEICPLFIYLVGGEGGCRNWIHHGLLNNNKTDKSLQQC